MATLRQSVLHRFFPHSLRESIYASYRSSQLFHSRLLCSCCRVYSSPCSLDHDGNGSFPECEKGDELYFGEMWRRLFYRQLVIYVAEKKTKERDDPGMFERSIPNIKRAKKLMGAPGTYPPSVLCLTHVTVSPGVMQSGGQGSLAASNLPLFDVDIAITLVLMSAIIYERFIFLLSRCLLVEILICLDLPQICMMLLLSR